MNPNLDNAGAARPGDFPRPFDPDLPWIDRVPLQPIRLPSRKPQLPPTLPPREREAWPPVIFRPRPNPFPRPPPIVEQPIDPSLVLKAYSTALRPFLTLERDLSRAHQAIFIANPLQYGVPSGMERDEFLNEAIFGIANPVQNPESPAFSRAGNGFFQLLQSYVLNVKDAVTQSTGITVEEAILQEERKKRARNDYEAANSLVAVEFAKLLVTFEQAHQIDKTLTMMEWINSPPGDTYRDAIEDRRTKSNNLKALQTTGTFDVTEKREEFEVALTKTEFKQGHNMPSTLRDLDAEVSSNDELPPAGIIYRPLHYLSGYDLASTRWVEEYPIPPQKLLFDLKDAARVQWKDLGFPLLDAEAVVGGTPDFEIWLEYTGIQSFDISRGLWDIEGFRDTLPPLLATAAPVLKNPILKTVKVLIGYDVDVVIKLPGSVLSTLPVTGSKVQLPSRIISALSDLVGYLPATLRDNGEIHARSDKDNAYPALLAVLTQAV
ncbi:hypothetical protein ONS95_003288 [Cadophora gregata]|uniref:uncharacterized protein n=1 Tax=Cadophora gregata TaxID=51156 RepID=UPI0026DCF1EE|nr:uncharacterized protein ONS95_003288 [Cadophora gregata]KAK0108484.1 hypothetical protein ONS95_003288 [Cadophora gregata]KAK0108923.1 hypothetical protein ONS96_002759 [Cadophora gregata f. sp. sojae]